MKKILKFSIFLLFFKFINTFINICYVPGVSYLPSPLISMVILGLTVVILEKIVGKILIKKGKKRISSKKLYTITFLMGLLFLACLYYVESGMFYTNKNRSRLCSGAYSCICLEKEELCECQSIEGGKIKCHRAGIERNASN